MISEIAEQLGNNYYTGRYSSNSVTGTSHRTAIINAPSGSTFSTRTISPEPLKWTGRSD